MFADQLQLLKSYTRTVRTRSFLIPEVRTWPPGRAEILGNFFPIFPFIPSFWHIVESGFSLTFSILGRGRHQQHNIFSGGARAVFSGEIDGSKAKDFFKNPN